MKYFVNVLVDVLGAVYQAAGASLLIAVLIMCVYMLGRKQGVGPVARAWIRQSMNLIAPYSCQLIIFNDFQPA